MSDSSADTGQGTGMYWDRKGAGRGDRALWGLRSSWAGAGTMGTNGGTAPADRDGRQQNPRPARIGLLGAAS